LPVRAPREDEYTPAFPPPETAVPLDVVALSEPDRRWSLGFDPASGQSSVQMAGSQARRFVDQGLELRATNRTIWSVTEDDPLSASNTVENTWGARRGDWQVRVVTSSSMTADATYFHITNVVEAFEGDTRVRTRTHSARIPRDNV
jgi:hypothetical protein